VTATPAYNSSDPKQQITIEVNAPAGWDPETLVLSSEPPEQISIENIQVSNETRKTIALSVSVHDFRSLPPVFTLSFHSANAENDLSNRESRVDCVISKRFDAW
jgi:hypothetical protein